MDDNMNNNPEIDSTEPTMTTDFVLQQPVEAAIPEPIPVPTQKPIPEPVPQPAPDSIPEPAQKPAPDPIPQPTPPPQYNYQGNYQSNYQQNGNQQGNQDMNYIYNTGYNPNYKEEGLDETPLTLGEWVLTILAMLIPCFIGIGIYFYWAFSKNGNVNRRNYCRAALIISGVVFIIYLVFMIFFGMAFFSNMYY